MPRLKKIKKEFSEKRKHGPDVGVWRRGLVLGEIYVECIIEIYKHKKYHG